MPGLDTSMTTRLPRGVQPQISTERLDHGGWTVSSSRAPIIGDPQIGAYCDLLGKVLTLPEILFGNSKLALRHKESGFELSFTALHALQGWKAEDLPPLKVQVATEWQAARQQEIAAQSAIILEYDWTYTTPYQGTLSYVAAQPPAAAGSTPMAAADPAADPGWSRLDLALPDGTKPKLQPATFPAQPTPAAAADAPPAPEAPSPAAAAPATSEPSSVDATPGAAGSVPPLPTWQPTSRQIDRGMLMSTDEPILFYAEVPLYESELDDNGACSLVVKVRVMRRCWLVLLRFFLRVDNSLVRLRDTRLFCRLDEPGLVLRETKHCEATLQELAAAGGSGSSGAYADADAAAAVFSAIAPAAVKLFQMEQLQL